MNASNNNIPAPANKMNDNKYLRDFVGNLAQNMTVPAVNSNYNANNNINNIATITMDTSPAPIPSMRVMKMADVPMALSCTPFSVPFQPIQTVGPKNCFAFENITRPPPPPEQRGSTTTATPRSSNNNANTKNRSRKQQIKANSDKKKVRAKVVKGATNLAREARVMKHRLNCILDAFQETIEATKQSHTTKLESLRAENQQLISQVEELEIETLKQASELEDSDELMVQMEERRLASKQETSDWKERCKSLEEKVESLQQSLQTYSKTETGKVIAQNQKLMSENESLKRELATRENKIRELGNKLFVAKMHRIGSNDDENNKENNHSAIEIDTLDPNAEYDFDFRTPCKTPSRKRNGSNLKASSSTQRKSVHGMTLRGSHHRKRFEF